MKSALTTDELCDQLVALLNDGSGQEVILDLLGYENFDLAATILSHSKDICANCIGMSFTSRSSHGIMLNDLVPGQSITVTTSAQKMAEKQQHRLIKKGILSKSNFITDANDMHSQQRAIMNGLREAQRLAFTGQYLNYPFVFTGKKSLNVSLDGKVTMPNGTIRHDELNYEEFVIPFAIESDSDNPIVNTELVKIEEMKPLLKKAFQGYQTLNRMQSIVYPTLLGSNQNILVCAPTGAGKTDVAFMAIMKTILDHSIVDVQNKIETIDRQAFKMVYVAPMKALAAEIAAKFSKRLKPFDLKAREYTGDMQLSKKEINETHLIITTPEKWDVITRKSHGDHGLVQKVCLLIIDEVHLLQEDRGAVIETLVARTLRESEISQRLIRIIGLSATLPNFVDVALFLRVDPLTGMFVFGDSFRPVPLTQSFVGIKGKGSTVENMNLVCYEKCIKYLSEGHQVMIFVHSRMETIKAAKTLVRQAKEMNTSQLFLPEKKIIESSYYDRACSEVKHSRNNELKSLFAHGLSFHNAGMLRQDRSMVERLFETGVVRVLVCTSTLAWGVNLPAHAVIIKGTQVYDQTKGDFVNLGVLDVLQIFGRAGRPQYETHGEGIILTAHANLNHYISSILSQKHIESRLTFRLADNLNAEVALGTVGSISEAVSWLQYTYLYVRMRRNPIAYGLQIDQVSSDEKINNVLTKMAVSTAKRLADAGMVVFDSEGSKTIAIREVGRIASNFYLSVGTVELWGGLLDPGQSEDKLLGIVAASEEFSHLKVREDELHELDSLKEFAFLRISQDSATSVGKASLLIQARISRCPLESFSLISDSTSISESAGRITRALFEIIKSQGWTQAAIRALNICKSYERNSWMVEHPLAQYNELTPPVVKALGTISIENLRKMSKKSIEQLAGNHVRTFEILTKAIKSFPTLNIQHTIQPINYNIIRIKLRIEPTFIFPDLGSKSVESWWVFVEDPLQLKYLSLQEFSISDKDQFKNIVLNVPVTHHRLSNGSLRYSLPPSLYIRILSDRWLHADYNIGIKTEEIVFPENSRSFSGTIKTFDSLSYPLISSKIFEMPSIIEHFGKSLEGPISSLFSDIYLSEDSLIINGSSISSTQYQKILELTIIKGVNSCISSTIIFITTSYSSAYKYRQYLDGSLSKLGISVSLFTGYQSCTPIKGSHVIVSWVEKFSHLTKSNLNHFGTLIIDELSDVCTKELLLRPIQARLIAFSTLNIDLGTVKDISEYLNIKRILNFSPKLRENPLQIKIEGLPIRHWESRQSAMNKPIYESIREKCQFNEQAIVVVPTISVAHSTVRALISFCVNEGTPRCFIRMPEDLLDDLLNRSLSISDSILRLALGFGVSILHDRLSEDEKKLSESLFRTGKCQILIQVANSCSRNNFYNPLNAQLVIFKGTETNRVDANGYDSEYPLNFVMHVINRAVSVDPKNIALCVFYVAEPKKLYYKQALSGGICIEPETSAIEEAFFQLSLELIFQEKKFGPVELVNVAREKTFFARRILSNPLYYGIPDSSSLNIDEYLLKHANSLMSHLVQLGVLDKNFKAGHMGHMISMIKPNLSTLNLLSGMLVAEESVSTLIDIISCATELETLDSDIIRELQKIVKKYGKFSNLGSTKLISDALRLFNFGSEKLNLKTERTNTTGKGPSITAPVDRESPICALYCQAIDVLRTVLSISLEKEWPVTLFAACGLLSSILTVTSDLKFSPVKLRAILRKSAPEIMRIEGEIPSTSGNEAFIILTLSEGTKLFTTKKVTVTEQKSVFNVEIKCEVSLIQKKKHEDLSVYFLEPYTGRLDRVGILITT